MRITVQKYKHRKSSKTKTTKRLCIRPVYGYKQTFKAPNSNQVKIKTEFISWFGFRHVWYPLYVDSLDSHFSCPFPSVLKTSNFSSYRKVETFGVHPHLCCLLSLTTRLKMLHSVSKWVSRWIHWEIEKKNQLRKKVKHMECDAFASFNTVRRTKLKYSL